MKRKKKQMNIISDTMEKYCKSCGRVFKDSDFKICPYCGNQLSTRTGRQPIPRKLRHQVFQRDGYRCRECGATNKQTRLHVDHIKPVAKGGTNDLSNLQTLCEACNRAKYTDEWIGGSYNSHYKSNLNVDSSLYELNRKQREINLANHFGKKINESNVSQKYINLNNDIELNNNIEPKNDIDSFSITRCPKCNTVLNRKAKKCIKCGKKITRSKKEVNLESLSQLDKLNYVASSFKKNKDIKLVSEHTGVNEFQIQKWFKLGKRGQWPYKIFYDKVSKFM
ncbi:HNH endonuclease [uncultured Methanobrevibacter sp.]|uniref:HNH endonuclease n=1 Tax=uncultured Methanobrevibacter sp. TaxID=253161 RepID=UPI0025D3EBFF|nr:HNH endonuclease [uncultured Methanobrevibacter sp.]